MDPWSALITLAGFGVIELIAWRVRITPMVELRRSYWEYWPAIKWGLWCQILTIVLSMFLFHRGAFAYYFLFASFLFEILSTVLVVTRLHPKFFERLLLPMVPLAILLTVHWIELKTA